MSSIKGTTRRVIIQSGMMKLISKYNVFILTNINTSEAKVKGKDFSTWCV